MSDQRIVHGARCTWWDSIDKAGRTPFGEGGHRLPACPHCGSVLFEMENESAFLAGVSAYEADGHPGYGEMLKWARGKCFKGVAEMQAAYVARLTP